jgi:tRNA-splicing ligase RtcB
MMELRRIDDYRLLVPRSAKAGMRVDGLIYADERLGGQIVKDQTVEQVANVATLPGLVGHSLAMPDAHQGYGFCIGGVAASDPESGVVSAGGVGFDINCGVRLLVSGARHEDVADRVPALMDELFREIPCGTGKKGAIGLTGAQLGDVLVEGARWAVRSGFGSEADLPRIEERGTLAGADPEAVSRRAKERGSPQLGTLGSGNHFLELQRIEEIEDRAAAAAFGLEEGRLAVMIHSGSRGLGHQVCTDYLETMQEQMARYGIRVIDRQLACVPVGSPEGKAYLSAMAAAANFAFANRQMMTHWARDAFGRILGRAGLALVYDVCHNIAKFEEHGAGNHPRTLLVHRKGATRAFPAGHQGLPDDLRPVGQPVLIPGSMGTSSYVLVGTPAAMAETFGSSCHGAGRSKSRTQARKETSGDELMADMRRRGIYVKGQSRSGLTEEKPDAYKDVGAVVNVVHRAGIARKVARLVPVAVMKG